MKMLLRGIITMLSLLAFWQLLVWLFQLPPYILPGPYLVFKTGFENAALIGHQAIPTIIETLFGLGLGIFFGMLTALMMASFQPFRLWLMPLIIISQAIPIFAIAPLLVIWFGYGMASKIATTVLMLFFPITSAFFDGLKNTNKGWIDLAKTMGSSPFSTLLTIQIPAALPSLATGIRVAAAIAPIGAVVGEWVGSSKGLGFLMLNANARMEIALMFAALFAIILFSLALYFSIDKLLSWAIPWQKEIV